MDRNTDLVDNMPPSDHGKLASDEDKPHDGWTSSHWPDWPSQFNHFWKKYTDAKTHNHLRHAVQHYVDCDRIFNDGALNYSIVASRPDPPWRRRAGGTIGTTRRMTSSHWPDWPSQFNHFWI